MVLLYYEPQAPATTILLAQTSDALFPYDSGRVPPSMAGMDIFEHPPPLGSQLSGREAGGFKGKRRKVSPILTRNSVICSVNIPMQDTVPSKRANSGYSQILILVVHLLNSTSLSPSIYPIFHSPHTLPSCAVFNSHTHAHTYKYHPPTMKLFSLIIAVHFTQALRLTKAEGFSGYLLAIVCADAVLVWVQLNHSSFDPLHTRRNHTRCGTAR